MITRMNESLEFLRDKYGFPAGTVVAGSDYFCVATTSGTFPLLPHRVERRIIELKKMIDSATLEEVSTLRFAKFTAGCDLKKLLAAELDLAEYLADSPVVRIFAGGDGKKVCNCIVRFANGISASIECGINLPVNTKNVDRHEIIARRGVGCDRGVDTQVPQHSIYLWNTDGETTFTDVDTELFGLPDDAIWIVRAAYAVLKDASLPELWSAAARRSVKLADCALESISNNLPVNVEGGF